MGDIPFLTALYQRFLVFLRIILGSEEEDGVFWLFQVALLYYNCLHFDEETHRKTPYHTTNMVHMLGTLWASYLGRIKRFWAHYAISCYNFGRIMPKIFCLMRVAYTKSYPNLLSILKINWVDASDAGLFDGLDATAFSGSDAKVV